MTDLRPTLFLAQLSNLLAGNISIVHGVAGSSRTFMGEEAAGVDAVRIALRAHRARARATSSLVGGAYNAQRPDMLLHYEIGGHAAGRTRSRRCWARQARAAAWCWARSGAFLVLESARARRGARRASRWRDYRGDRDRPQPAARPARRPPALRQACWRRVAPQAAPRHAAVISGATGAAAGDRARSAASCTARRACRCARTGTRFGHGWRRSSR